MILRVATFTELDPATLYALLRLRCDVFVVEQRCAYPELDGRDVEPGTRHVWLSADEAPGAGPARVEPGLPAAYLRILTEPDGGARIGRVCTRASARGVGLAGRLLRAALDLVSAHAHVSLDAQRHLHDFYASFGFTRVGADYLEDGIPHLPMRLSPRTSP